MAKKRTAEEYHQTAKANGWEESAHEEKNNKDPENHMSEVVVYEHPLLKFDLTGFLLQMVFREGMLLGIDMPAQLYEQPVSEGKPLLELLVCFWLFCCL